MKYLLFIMCTNNNGKKYIKKKGRWLILIGQKRFQKNIPLSVLGYYISPSETEIWVFTQTMKTENVMSEELRRDYRVCEEIGRGRFGVVFKCYSPETGQNFAVKSINKLLIADDSIDRQCLYNEAKIMHLVSPNPHIVSIADVCEDDTYLDIVLELCNSSDLFQRLSTQRLLSESDAIAVMVLVLFQ